MVPVSPKEKSLYDEAKTGFRSLLQQTAAVFIGFAIMLLITGGAPSAVIVALSFFLSTTCVALAEKNRLVAFNRLPKFEAIPEDLSAVSSGDPPNPETTASENADFAKDIDAGIRASKSSHQKDTPEAKLNHDKEAVQEILVLFRYTKDGLHLETSSLSLEYLIAQRVLFYLRLGKSLIIEPGQAAFVVNSNSLGLPRFLSAIRGLGEEAITASFADADYVEINVRGTWVASSEEAEEGLFLMRSNQEIALSLYRLWHEQSQQISLQRE